MNSSRERGEKYLRPYLTVQLVFFLAWCLGIGLAWLSCRDAGNGFSMIWVVTRELNRIVQLASLIPVRAILCIVTVSECVRSSKGDQARIALMIAVWVISNLCFAAYLTAYVEITGGV